jgi:hypothetical protein
MEKTTMAINAGKQWEGFIDAVLHEGCEGWLEVHPTTGQGGCSICVSPSSTHNATYMVANPDGSYSNYNLLVCSCCEHNLAYGVEPDYSHLD